MFQGCHPPLIINGRTERVVIEQIQQALKIITERMEQKSSQRFEYYLSKNEHNDQNSVSDDVGYRSYKSMKKGDFISKDDLD